MASLVTDEQIGPLIDLAERYPFARPERSYVFRNSRGAVLEDGWRQTRTPVLAIGANASPERLTAKFGDRPGAIPVTRARLAGFVVAYAAHYASYGAIPATLHPAEGATVAVFVTWLDRGQIEVMHRSEGVGQRYHYLELQGLDVDAEGIGRVERAGAYVSRAGAFNHGGGPVRVAGIGASDAPYPVWDQPRMLEQARRRLEPDLDYRTFMTRIVRCFGYRSRQTARLSRGSLAF